jgi:PmbA protein
MTSHSALSNEDACALLIEESKKFGATGTRSILSTSQQTTIEVRDSDVTVFEKQAFSRSVALTAWIGDRVSHVATERMGEDSLRNLAESACSIAKASTPDPFTLLAPSDLWPKDHERLLNRLELIDTASAPNYEETIERAKRMEHAARSVDGVTRTEKIGISQTRSGLLFATSDGIMSGLCEGTQHSMFVEVLSGSNKETAMGSDFSTARFLSDLRTPEDLGRSAGEEAVRRLGAKSIPTEKMPVVLDRKVSASLLEYVLAGASGDAVFDKATFLKDELGKRVFNQGINIKIDPHIPRGLKSTPFDGEGISTEVSHIVKDGVLNSLMLSLGSAKKLGLDVMEHTRSAGNVFMDSGECTQEELIGDIKRGLFVTLFMGRGVNIVTGDYSRSVYGFLIEDGVLTCPVNGVTISGNLIDMFASLKVANDLKKERGVDAPTVHIEEMTVAGK